MNYFLLGMAIMVGAGLAALAAGASARWSSRIGAGGAVLGCSVALVPALSAVFGTRIVGLKLPWAMPGANIHLELDALSGFFLLPILGVSALAAVYGVAYLASYAGKKTLGGSWLFFNLLIVSMAFVVVARDGLLFLLAWETMALVSFFLVAFEHEKASVRRAGWTYMAATHVGTAFLLVLFLVLQRESGSFEFAAWHKSAALMPGLSGLLFVFAVIGFGTKAGFVPLHIWLPEAHPAAPSHVSALMSGVMIKTGIYGLVRMILLLGPPEAWWGWVLIGVGVSSGLFGVLFALAQHDLKRLLAYHSVENIGIITLGLGLGVLGLALHLPLLALLGFAGGLLHVLNHAMFKGLLFLGAGAVLHATGTLEIDRLGGLSKKMGWTSALFLLGSAAIAGLPPLNGFVSEFLIYLASFQSLRTPSSLSVLVPSLIAIVGLALIGGFAAACFAKAFGIVFLGTPRSAQAANAHEVGPLMRIPMMILALGCILIGILPALVLPSLAPSLGILTGQSTELSAQALEGFSTSLHSISLAAAVLLVLVLVLVLLRRALLAGRVVEETGTWDCGYAQPTARMQYTASSFARPLTAFFDLLLRTKRHQQPVEGLFPQESSLQTHTADLFTESLYGPLLSFVASQARRAIIFQQGRVQIYVLYIVVTLLALLGWEAM